MNLPRLADRQPAGIADNWAFIRNEMIASRNAGVSGFSAQDTGEMRVSQTERGPVINTSRSHTSALAAQALTTAAFNGEPVGRTIENRFFSG
ncbi:hypothetical protein SAMN05446635_9856 [Burkholderia sp. OK233]|nr:hypothetical protein SAMN05446635_9856 [Burkholderia sp. OK233]